MNSSSIVDRNELIISLDCIICYSQIMSRDDKIISPNPQTMDASTMSPTPSKFKVMTLSDAAAQRAKAIMAGKENILGLRLGVKNGGCAGMEYTMDWATEATPGDEIVEDNGVKILIDPKAVLFLLGTQMDYQVDKLSAKFVFNNPNQSSACGCGESVNLTAASPDALAAAKS